MKYICLNAKVSEKWFGLVFKNIEEPIVKALRWIKDKFGREKEGTISETPYWDGETYRSDSRL